MRTVTIADRPFELYWFTGRVATATKNLETQVHGGGGGGYVHQGTGYSAPVAISSTTTVHDQLFLIGKDGDEQAFQLQGFNVACRESNHLTVLWAMRQGAATGPYVLVVNHTTKDAKFNEDSLRALLGPSKVLFTLAALGVFFLGLQIGGVINSSLVGFLTIVGVPLGTVVMFKMKANERVRQFKESIRTTEFVELEQTRPLKQMAGAVG
jgi:hypothetical protein